MPGLNKFVKARAISDLKASLIIVAVLLVALAIAHFINTNIESTKSNNSNSSGWGICYATVYLSRTYWGSITIPPNWFINETTTFPVLKTDTWAENVKLYVAHNRELASEGYKHKDSIDFLGIGARGMLFPLFMLYNSSEIVITMKDVKFPLYAQIFTAEINIPSGYIREKLNITTITLRPLEGKMLQPGREYIISKPLFGFLIEWDPAFVNDTVTVKEVVIRNCR